MNDIPASALDLFQQTGAYLRGHFRLTSGLHSPEYLQCALVLQHPAIAERLGRELAARIRTSIPGVEPTVVVSPALGGIIIGHEVARAFGTRFLFTERDPQAGMCLRRGFSLGEDEVAVVIEDVVTTGGSSREVVDLLRARGVDVAAAGSIIDRSGGRVDIGVQRVALATLQAITYAPEDCPLCRDGMPVEKPGSRPPAKS